MPTEWTTKMEYENCDKGSHPSVLPSHTLATYRWTPAQGPPRALVLLLHGFRAHACYNFLSEGAGGTGGSLTYGDETNTSFVRELTLRQCHVESHDHIGHGRSTGLRAYFPSIDVLVQDAVQHTERMRTEYPGLPLFLVGHSLGGTLALKIARDYPDLVQGMCLSSAACEPPANMLGIKGNVLALFSNVLSTVIPRVQVLALPTDNVNNKHAQRFAADPLNNAEVQLRARVGREFIVAYKDIADRKKDITTPVLAYSGELDTLVNPDATKRLIDAVSSKDKSAQVAKGRWHNLLVEDGKEEIWIAFAEWIDQRAQ